MKRMVFQVVCLAIVSSCAVEAGNPTGKKPKGTAAVSFVQTTSLSGDQFTLPLESISLVPSDNSGSSSQSLTLSKQEMNLLSNTPSSDSTEVAKSEVEAGTYSGVIITIPERKPPRYRSSPTDRDTELGTDNLDQRGFKIEQSITIKEGESTPIIIRLDPLSSMNRDGGNLRFDPRGEAFPRAPMAQFKGTAPITNAVSVCAYGYGLTKMTPPPQMMTGRGLLPPLGPPPPGVMSPGMKFNARPHKSYATKADVTLDTTSSCSNAFTKTSVNASDFILDRLLPGNYALRFFRADETYVDQTTDIAVTAP